MSTNSTQDYEAKQKQLKKEQEEQRERERKQTEDINAAMVVMLAGCM